MKPTIAILCMILFALSPLLTISMNAAKKASRTITLKKTKRYPKSDGLFDKRMPSALICCYVDSETGIQQLDTSEIESYEIWDRTDTVPIVIFEDEAHFVDYILNDDAQGIIKLFSTDYIYEGILDSSSIN